MQSYVKQPGLVVQTTKILLQLFKIPATQKHRCILEALQSFLIQCQHKNVFGDKLDDDLKR